MRAQELAPSRSGLQWMLRKFKFKIKQKKRQECCLKKKSKNSFYWRKGENQSWHRLWLWQRVLVPPDLPPSYTEW